MRSVRDFGEDGDVTIQARQVDPRDVNVEVDAPTFRVYFWRTAPDLACREFEVTGGDVHEVVRWADLNVGPDETYELGVLTRVAGMQPGDVVLTRIKGSDPTRTDGEDGTPATAHG